MTRLAANGFDVTFSAVRSVSERNLGTTRLVIGSTPRTTRAVGLFTDLARAEVGGHGRGRMHAERELSGVAGVETQKQTPALRLLRRLHTRGHLVPPTRAASDQGDPIGTRGAKSPLRASHYTL